MDPQIPIEVKDDEWLVRAFRMRVAKDGVTTSDGLVITEANLNEFTDPYDLTGKKITVTIRTEKSSSFVPLILDSDVDGILIIDPLDGLWRFNVDKIILARMVNRKDLFYSVVITDVGIPDRAWSGPFLVSRR